MLIKIRPPEIRFTLESAQYNRGTPKYGTKGLGVLSVSGRNLVPRPADRMRQSNMLMGPISVFSSVLVIHLKEMAIVHRRVRGF